MAREAEIFRVSYNGTDWGSMNGVIGGARPEKGRVYEITKTAWKASSDDWVLASESTPNKVAKSAKKKTAKKKPAKKTK